MLTVQSVTSSLSGTQVILPGSKGAISCCRITEDRSDRDRLISDLGDSLSLLAPLPEELLLGIMLLVVDSGCLQLLRTLATAL